MKVVVSSGTRYFAKNPSFGLDKSSEIKQYNKCNFFKLKTKICCNTNLMLKYTHKREESMPYI